LQKKGNGWYCQFLHHGKRHTFTIGPVSKAEACAKLDRVDYLPMRLKQRLIELPAGFDIVEFVQRDGKPGPKPGATSRGTALTLADFRDRYLATNRDSRERRSIEGIELHFKHRLAALGERFPIGELKLADLQGYIDRRAKARGLKAPTSPADRPCTRSASS
jgi:hypothetical protein